MGGDERQVIVRLERLPRGFMKNWPVLDALMREGAQYAWSRCPHTLGPAYGDRQDYSYDVNQVAIFAPNGTRLMGAIQLHIERERDGTHRYHWESWINLKRADELAADQLDEAIRAASARATQAPPDSARSSRTKLRAEDQLPDDWWVWPFAITCFLAWVFRNQLAYLYYRYFTEHPAKELIDQAIGEGTALDGERFGRLVTRTALNDAEERARSEQTAALTSRWQAHTDYLEYRTREEIRTATAEAERDAERLAAEIALMEAAIAHEQAAARFRALTEDRK